MIRVRIYELELEDLRQLPQIISAFTPGKASSLALLQVTSGPHQATFSPEGESVEEDQNYYAW